MRNKQAKHCPVCGNILLPDTRTTYQIEEPRELSARIFGSQGRTFDAMDCPGCGCQIPLAVRLPAVATKKED